MLKYLLDPYPLRKSWRADLLFALGTGLFVGWFLVTFQPDDTYNWEHPYKYPFLWGYGGVVFVGLLIIRFLIPALLPRLFREEKWTVGKHIIYILISFYGIIAACYLYLIWFMESPFSWRGLLGFSLTSFTIAVFPISAIVMINYIRQLKKYQRGADRFNEQFKVHPAQVQDLIELPDEQGQIQLKIPANQLRYLQSAMNYVEVYYLDNGQLRKELLRNTLKNMEAHLPSPPFLRTHRSFIVNQDLVTGVSGNAQGYKLHFADLEDLVPVSRSRSKTVLEALDQ
jgi:hypothetical protein